MRVRTAALAGNGVDRFDVFRAHVVEHFAHQADGFVFAHARPHGAVEFVVGGVDHHGGMVEQRDFVLRLDDACVGHELLAVDDLDSLLLQREQDGRLDDVDAERLVLQAAAFRVRL